MSSLVAELRRRFDWVVCDVDGTIHDPSTEPGISDAFTEFLVAWDASGGRWGVATGRDEHDLGALLSEHPKLPAPGFRVTTDQLVHIRVGGGDRPLDAFNEPLRRHLARYFDRHRHQLARLASGVRARFGDIVYADPLSPLCVEAITVEDVGGVERLWRRTLGQHPDGGGAFTRGDRYGRATIVGAHKGSAVRAALVACGASRTRTVAAGNDLNDLPMLHPRVVGAMVAPGNAIPVVRRRVLWSGGMVGSGCASVGVLEALGRLAGRSR